jgi:predicted nucleic acid-binding protein
VILVDANIIMYAAGADHAHKQPSLALLEQVGSGAMQATIDAGILQEILHRYRAIRRWADGRRVYDLTRQLFPSVLPVTADVLDRARQLLDRDTRIMARDALHAAVALMHGLDAICSYDRDFDRIPGITRLEPPAR